MEAPQWDLSIFCFEIAYVWWSYAKGGLPRCADALAQAKVARPILVFAVLGIRSGGPPGPGGSKTTILGGGSKRGGGAENAISRKPTLDRGRLTLNPPIYTVFKIAVFGPILPPPFFRQFLRNSRKNTRHSKFRARNLCTRIKTRLTEIFPGEFLRSLVEFFPA